MRLRAQISKYNRCVFAVLFHWWDWEREWASGCGSGLIPHLKFNFAFVFIYMPFYLMGARVLRLLIFVYVLLRSALFSTNSGEPNEMSAKRRSKERENKITQRKRDHSIYLHIIDRGQILGNWMLFCVFCPFGQEKRQHTQPQWTSEKKRKHIASHHTERENQFICVWKTNMLRKTF